VTDIEIIKKCKDYVQQELKDAEGGHDWWHIQRVWNNALIISEKEGGHKLIIELAALLHDIADSKFHNGDEEIGPKKAAQFLKSLSLPQSVIDAVDFIIRNISFKGGNFENKESSLELDIVQDADRLDALGAIGIARTFNYGGFKNRPLYDPSIKPNLNLSKEEYKSSKAPTLNHFYEKLFRLKDKMNTKTGRQMAEERHQFMEEYVDKFLEEFNGPYS
tara:strand:- start:3487 stop:4143 length:657 start_codon:yes stop_codon:yes gene_type:complete